MKHYIGLQTGQTTNTTGPAIFYEPSKLLTGHALIAGVSGSGKSYQAEQLINSAAHAGLQVDIFDVHEELHNIPNCTAVKFSQATRYGFNPLTLETDIHTGGPLRQTEFIVSLIKDVSPTLGIQQETVLRNLCMDTYAAHGIFQDSNRSWHKKEITEQERIRFLNSNMEDELKKYYPTLEDLKIVGTRKIHALALGTDNESVKNWFELVSLMKKMTRLNAQYQQGQGNADTGDIVEKIIKLKEKYKESSNLFVDNMKTGQEIDDLIKYKSLDTLQSVMARLEILNSNGIFRSNPPPFGSNPIKVYQIKSLTTEQQILLVKLQIKRAFEDAKRAGKINTGDPPRHLIYVEEAHLFFNNDPNDILNILGKESRKFGIALVCASQQPNHFPQDFLTNVGMTMLCGIHTSFWKKSSSEFGISEQMLQDVKPKEILALKLQHAHETNPPFKTIIVPNDSTIMGRRAIAQKSTT